MWIFKVFSIFNIFFFFFFFFLTKIFFFSDKEKIGQFTTYFQKLFYLHEQEKTPELSEVVSLIEKAWTFKELLKKYHQKDLIPANYVIYFEWKIEDCMINRFLEKFKKRMVAVYA